MSIALKIVLKTITTEFFKQYALYFFIVLYFSFGILSSAEHISFNQYMLSTNALQYSALCFIFWTAYNLWLISFFSFKVKQSKYLFIHNLFLYTPFIRNSALAIMHLVMLLPTIAYAIFISKIAVLMGAWIYVKAMPFFFLITICYSIAIYNSLIKNADTQHTKSYLTIPLPYNFRKHSFSFYFYELFLKQPVLFFLSKLFSCTILISCLTLFIADHVDDYRPLAIALLLSGATNIPLALLFHQYNTATMLYFRNLPASWNTQITKPFLTFLLLVAPEFFLMKKFLIHPALTPHVLVFILLPLLLLLYYALQYHPAASNSSFNNYVFYGGFAGFILILSGFPLTVIGFTGFSASVFIIKKYYYTFETKINLK